MKWQVLQRPWPVFFQISGPPFVADLWARQMGDPELQDYGEQIKLRKSFAPVGGWADLRRSALPKS